MMKRRCHLVRYSIALALPLMWLLSGCGKSTPVLPPATPVRATEAVVIQTTNPLKYSADIVPMAQVDLAFQSGGYIAKLRQVKGADGQMRAVQQGDWVTRGTVLALVSEEPYQDKLAQAKSELVRAKAAYEVASLNFQRARNLYGSQSLTKPDYDSAKGQFDSAAAAVSEAKAGVSQAETMLGYCSLKAPFQGWVLKRNVELGTLAGPSTVGFTMADVRTVKAVFGVPDTAIQRVRLGHSQAITTDASPGEFLGRITAISPAADPKSRVYSVEVTVPNPHNQLKAGMIASVSLGEGSPSQSLTAVPLSAIIRDPNRADGFAVLIADGREELTVANLRPVEVGEATGNLISVRQGLKPGERVVTSGATLIKSGDRIHVIP
jgi:multidrug efflux system membrane fusion protein